MLARTGLHTSQPRPRPNRSMTALKVSRPETCTASKSWRRERSKCSHSPVETALPSFASSPVTRDFTMTVQEPQVAPALVQAVTSAASVQPCSRTAWRIVPALTEEQEQTIASSGSSGVGAEPAPAGRRCTAGSAPSAPPTRGRREP